MLHVEMLRLEVACFLILAFVAFIYFSGARRHDKMHRSFSLVIIMVMAQIFFDGATLITVHNMSIYPSWLNDGLHRFYFATMLGGVYLFYEHTCLLVEEEGKEYNSIRLSPRLRTFTRIEVIISELGMCFAPLSYAITPSGNYAIGPCSDIIYFNVPFYVALIIIILIVNWNGIHPKKKFAIVAALCVELGALIFTSIIHTALITSIGFTLMTLSFYLTLENPDIYLLEQAREEKKRAEEANASKSNFLSVVSHEIRTPLNAIAGMADLLLNESLTPAQQSYIKNIKSSSNSLVMIVNDLLDQSKIEAGKMEIIEDNYEVAPLLDEIKLIIENRTEGKPIDIMVNVAPNIPPVIIGDRLRIKQVLINLMNNAVKFTASGYIKLSLVVEKEDDNQIYIRFGVKDSGQGIREEDLSRLFEAFSQVDTKKNHEIEGTGLGLSISRDFVALMGGKINVSSIYGVGSEFYFTIPQGKVANDTPISVEEEVPIAEFTAPKAKILVVDDTPLNLTVAEKLLHTMDIIIDQADSGQAAIDMIKNNDYHIVLMDYMMPNMTGIEATTRIRALASDSTFGDRCKYFRTLPVIALTADASKGTINAFTEAGVNDFIEKPIKLNVLKQALIKWLPTEIIDYK